LNEKAVRGEIEVTAISAAMYPHLKDRYWIMPIGASVGRDYGPVVAYKKGPQPAGKRIGIPGRNTTAFLLLRLYTEGFEPVVYRFDEIPAALERGDIDYALLIHEVQITYEKHGFVKHVDLGQAWMKDTGLPIPLGLDVIRKDLGRPLALEISAALKQSIVVANQQRDKAIEYALKFGRG
jgi:1,4-dihydroxy-6-naphthoate synthase